MKNNSRNHNKSELIGRFGGYLLVFVFGILAGRVTVMMTPSGGTIGCSSREKPSLTHVDNDGSNDDGWRTIEVFYGKEKPLPHQGSSSNIQWFSQAKQDQIVMDLLQEKSNGYFIDLAANHAFKLSNTIALERSYNWTGLCIEPNPGYWYDLTKYRSCRVVGAVVGGERMEQVDFVFVDSHGGGGLSDLGTSGGIVGYDQEEKDKDSRLTDKVYTVPLLEILDRFDAPEVIDYLSLDVEGAETLIMENFPFHQYTIRVMTIERPNDDLRQLLEQQGYEFVRRLTPWGETLWMHSSMKGETNTH